MTQAPARSWTYAAAAAGMIANALFVAFYASFAVQHFTGPRGVTAILRSAADYAGIPQNALLTVITGVVFRFLSRQQRPDQVLRITGAMVFATAAVGGVLTVTGLLPAVSALAAGAVLAAAAWLMAIGIRGAELPGLAFGPPLDPGPGPGPGTIAGRPPDPGNRCHGTADCLGTPKGSPIMRTAYRVRCSGLNVPGPCPGTAGG